MSARLYLLCDVWADSEYTHTNTTQLYSDRLNNGSQNGEVAQTEAQTDQETVPEHNRTVSPATPVY